MQPNLAENIVTFLETSQHLVHKMASSALTSFSDDKSKQKHEKEYFGNQREIIGSILVTSVFPLFTFCLGTQNSTFSKP